MSIGVELRLDRDDFSLDVALSLPGQGITAILGSSGSGKTTLLRAIAGLEPAARGIVRIGGQFWQKPGFVLPTHRRPLGYVFQEASLFPHLDVRRNLEYGLHRARGRARRTALDRAVELLGIGHLLNRAAYRLSGGERQRVAIARALAANPVLLLLDEPLASLDAPRRREILPYLESLHGESAVPMLYVTHARDEAARLADHVLLLDRGRVEAVAPLAELYARLDVSLVREPDAESVIEAKVAGHDAAWHLSRLIFPGGCFVVAGQALAVGRRVRLRVLARDVSLTLEHQEKTSILNIFPAIVEQISEESDAQVMVRLRLGETPLLSRITRRSAHDLALKPGVGVYAQVKSVALLV